jgi:RecB family exonuclease
MKNILNESQIANFPVRHISMSALRTYLTDRQAFFRRYVRLEYEKKESPALIEGKAVHAVLEGYWKAKKDGADFNWNEAVDEQERIIAAKDREGRIDWGKSGDLEKSQKNLRQAIDFYRESPPEYSEIVSIEDEFISNFEDLEGNGMPIPLKGFCDLVVKESEDYVIVDHKTVALVKQQDEAAPAFELQAAAYWFLVRKEYGINPKRMIFDQIKKTKNRDGSPQITPYVVEYTPDILLRFLELYARVVKELAGIPLFDPETGVMQFLPNPFAMFDWEESWADFCEEVQSGKEWNLSEIKVIQENRYSTEDVEALDI